MTYDVLDQGFRSRDKSRNKSHGRDCTQIAMGRTCKYCRRSHAQREITQHLVRNAKNAAEINTLMLYVKVVVMTNMIQVDPDKERVRVIKGKNSTKSLRITMTWVILQIKFSLYSTMMYILMQ